MQNNKRLLAVLQESVQALNTNGHFDGGQEFRPTQDQALKAYQTYLFNDNLTTEEKLKGFFEIPTGVGKTAVFVGIVSSAMKVMQARGEAFKVAVVVPTTQLLTQTQESFAKFAPDTADMIGFYGDGDKNSDMPITIMTYNAWYDLTVSGEMGAHNIDLMISDEAHRGTSEQRVETILDAYDSNTVQLAFTATAHFDKDKSVESSHEREIFYKSIGQAIREGELTSYIQSQRAVIRVEPSDWMLSDEFKQASEADKKKHRKQLRQKTWNDYATTIFRDGRDERTGDLLTDNQAGFFVDGIAQANHLQKLLNQDEVLQKRAQDQRCKGVAVAIHSKLSKTEQKRRLEAYMNGEYLAVIGDEKFKEGFDHPPMKTIIDYPHSSVVDKAQILGRGARKWWNDIKGRFEGLTIIDTVIYIGSPEKDVNEYYRETALCNAVTVKEILEESYVLGPEALKSDAPRKDGNGIGGGYGIDGILDDAPNIEYYSKIEDMHVIEAETAHLRKEHWVDITPEIYDFIQSEMERTGFSSKGLIAKFGQEVTPVDLTYGRLQNLLYGMQKSIPKDNLDWILDKFERLPTVERITITDSMCEKLITEMKRTNKGAVLVLEGVNDVPENINSSRIQAWKDKASRSVLQSDWDWLMKRYKSLPSVSQETEIDAKKRKKISDEFERTQARGALVITALEGQVPEGLNTTLINNIIDGKRTHIREDFWEATIKGYLKLEDMIILTDAKINAIKDEMTRTDLKQTTLLKEAPAKPMDLSDGVISAWMTRRVKRAKQRHYDFVINAYAKIPSVVKKDEIAITHDMVAFYNSERDRTGIKASKLIALDGISNNKPTASQLNEMSRGSLKSIPQQHWEWVKKSYAKHPSLHIFSDSDLEFMRAEIDRTKIGGKKFNALFGGKAPKGFGASMIGNWLGKTKSTPETYWKFVIDTYASLPTLDQRPKNVMKQRP